MKVLDACCGSKMFWFDKENPLTVFQDKRELDTNLCDGRQLIVKPDVIGDFTNMDWPDDKFKVVVFDPPHLDKLGEASWMALKYGKLPEDWRDYISKAFRECFRVLENDGVLIFKWNEIQIKTKEILTCSPYKPMFGHISGKRSDTHWVCFMKNELMISDAS
jgi:hypothetical protein